MKLKLFTLVVLLGLVAVAVADKEAANIDKEPAKKEENKTACAKVKLEDGVKKFDASSLIGTWYEMAASKLVAESFEKGCVCVITNITKIANEKHKFKVDHTCRNATTKATVTVNGTLTQLMPDEFPAAFRIDFKQQRGQSGPSVVHAQHEKQEKQHEKQNLKQEDEAEKKKKHVDIEKLKSQVNFIVLKQLHADKKDRMSLLLAGPTVDAAWILSRRATLEDNDYSQLVEYAKQKGFAELVRSKCKEDSSLPAPNEHAKKPSHVNINETSE